MVGALLSNHGQWSQCRGGGGPPSETVCYVLSKKDLVFYAHHVVTLGCCLSMLLTVLKYLATAACQIDPLTLRYPHTPIPSCFVRDGPSCIAASSVWWRVQTFPWGCLRP